MNESILPNPEALVAVDSTLPWLGIDSVEAVEDPRIAGLLSRWLGAEQANDD